MKKLAARFTLLLAVAGLALANLPADPNDSLWTSAKEAYRNGNTEAGHRELRRLIEQSPGDTDLAIKCLEQIFRHARATWSGEWQRYALERISALERIGAVSATSRIVQQAFEDHVSLRTSAFEFFEIAEDVDRVAEANSHDLFWRILQARSHERIESARARPLHEALKRDLDIDHPDDRSRDLWIRMAESLESDLSALPGPAEPLPNGSPLVLMEPDDPDGHWQGVADRAPRTVPELIDRLAGATLREDQVVPWRDNSGLTDPPRALDLHLRSQPAAELLPLRKLQAKRFRAEPLPSSPTESDVLAVFRRYPWATKAQRLLLEEAGRMLWSGRAESALRSFRDVLDHATESSLLAGARIGWWTALAQIGDSARLEAEIGREDPESELPWMGKPTTVRTIRERLITNPDPEGPAEPPLLRDIDIRVVRIPPVSPWPSDMPTSAVPVDLSVNGDELFVSGRNLLAVYDASVETETPPRKWVRARRHHVGERASHALHRGYYRPTIQGEMIFSRWGLTSEPRGIAAFDRATGRPLWTGATPSSTRNRHEIHVPLGDPATADGFLYWLQWNTHGDINHTNGRRISLVCFDAERRTVAWESTIAEAGRSSDTQASLERASPASAIYGNRVTVHDGAVYACSNAGIVSRSDIRDGRTDWIHYYRRGPWGGQGQELGTAPIVAGDKLICMPRDAGRVFALDLRTGRIIWENSLALPVESLGVFEAGIIVRGRTALVALELASGEALWHMPLPDPMVGRALRIGESIYFASHGELRRASARSGQELESRAWELGDERPRNFTIGRGALFVVTDRPAEEDGLELGDPLSANVPVDHDDDSTRLLRKAWTLRRNDAKLTRPPHGSPLAGRSYIWSGGILECLDTTARGAVRWRRFLDWRDSTMHFSDRTLLLSRTVSRSGQNRRAEISELIALDGESGRVKWSRRVPLRIAETIQQGSSHILHDRLGTLLALDLSSGGIVWERRFSRGELRAAQRLDAATELDVIYAFSAKARHLVLEASSGRTLREHRVTTVGGTGSSEVNGKLLSDGHYEVGFAPLEARYVRLVALSEINGQGWTSIAELEIVGADGANIPRDDWRVIRVDSQETKSRYDTSPRTVFDDDPSTWWHTKWIGGIPRHPHEIQIDLGAAQMIRGFRYLPAVIINNNEMIRDYEFYASRDAALSNEPVAKGILVDRTRLENPHLLRGSLVFEVRNHRLQTQEVFSYQLDGNPARRVADSARVAAVGESHVIVSRREEGREEILLAVKPTDPSYRFELGERRALDHGREIRIVGDRLLLTREQIIVADLEKKAFAIPASSERTERDHGGVTLLVGEHHLLKIVHRGKEGHSVYRIDLRDGTQEEQDLPDQTESFRDRRHGFAMPDSLHAEELLLLYDGSAISAWTVAAELAASS